MKSNFSRMSRNFPRITQRLSKISKIAVETTHHVDEVQLFLIASSLAFTTILSIIPVLAVSFSIFQAFGGMQKLYSIIEPLILDNLAQGSSQEVIELLHRFVENAHASAIGIGGMVGLVFTSMSMLLSAEKAINQIWNTQITRSLFQRISFYWLFITLGPLALSVALGIATSFNLPIWKYLPSGTGITLISMGVFFVIFKWVPQTVVYWQNALIASIFTTIFWDLARYAYTFYTQKVVMYNVVYGSLGAIPIFMLWIDIGWIIILIGAALTATLQKNFVPKTKH
ncbi:MAG: YhjD/YihY/BrkB family envelope integrity protein [Bdellovibrionia bacterium]